MAGAITLSQPGGAGTVVAGTAAYFSPGTRIYPTFGGAVTTTWTWAVVSSVPTGTATITYPTSATPFIDPGNVEGYYSVTFIDSNGAFFGIGFFIGASRAPDPDVEPDYPTS